MTDSQYEHKLIAALEELQKNSDEQVATKLELDKCKRIVQKLRSHSDDCAVCKQYFIEFEEHILQLKEKQHSLTEEDFKQHKQTIDNISAHLIKQHKLVRSGYYLSIYMSIGTSLGIVLGLLIFDNIGIGLPLGIGAGVAIDASLDGNAKKKGLVL